MSATARAAMSIHPTEVERKLWLPLLVILFALIVLLLVPVWVDQRAREMRAHSEGTIAAARTQIDALESQIALMAASIMGYVLSGDQQFLVDYRSSDARQDVAFSELLTLAESLDAGVLQQATHLGALTNQWPPRP
jgi:CHASE3 domain sensor protein